MIIDLASLSLLINLGQKLTGLGSDVQSAERHQILRFVRGLTERLESIASVIRNGGNQEGLTKLCADLESYGKVGASQLSEILQRANLLNLGDTVGAVARDIRDKSRTKWSPQARRSALHDLDEAIGQLSGMTGFLRDFHHGQPSTANNLVRWTRKVSLRSAAIGSSLVLGGAAKAASWFPGKAGEKTADYLEGVRENISEVISDVVDKIDPTDVA